MNYEEKFNALIERIKRDYDITLDNDMLKAYPDNKLLRAYQEGAISVYNLLFAEISMLEKDKDILD